MKCRICGEIASRVIGVCGKCIKKGFGNIEEVHRRTREKIGWSYRKGVVCKFCERECKIEEGKIGFCGLVRNRGGKLEKVLPWNTALGTYYFDPLPTNCVASYVCDLCRKGEKGLNLAVFYGSCNFNCLFCQNYSYREMSIKKMPRMEVGDLEKALEMEDVKCVCFFGGDPSCNPIHSILVGRKALELGKKVCFETNGYFKRPFLKTVLNLVKESEGYFKVDFKAWNEALYKALSFSSPEPVKRCIEMAFNEKVKLVVSTLIIPGYVEEEEVEKIAEFLSSLDPSIPYILLAFHPSFLMSDLPPTSRELMERCVEVAKDKLDRVFIGNEWLLM